MKTDYYDRYEKKFGMYGDFNEWSKDDKRPDEEEEDEWDDEEEEEEEWD